MVTRISERGFSVCRACDSERLVSVLDLETAEYGLKRLTN